MSDTPNIPQQTKPRDFPYFRRLWNTTVMTLLAASFIPYLFIGGIIYAYTASVLREKTLETLQADVLQQKAVIDRFLADRTRDLQLILKNLSLADLSEPGVLKDVFRSLSKDSSYFIDLGVIDARGHHVAYVGPYDLLSKNYQTSDWFVDTLTQQVYISDLFLGFRNIPHTIIAVKYTSSEGSWIVRATLDGGHFDKIVKEISYLKQGDAYLVNQNGIYQTTPRKFGKVMAQSDMTRIPHHEGVKLEEIEGRLRLTVWLEKVPWVSVVEMRKQEAFAPLYRVRNLVIYIFILSSLIMVFAILLTTNYLFTRLESKRKSIRHLDHQLRHTSRIATSATLSTGVFHKVKDCLANIDISAQWIDESLGGKNESPPADEGIHDTLQQIHHQILDTRRAIDKYLRITDASGPVIKDIHIHQLLNDLIELLDWEVQNKNAAIEKDYHAAIEPFRSDPASVRHILQSLIHNAIEAIPHKGRITLRARAEQAGVRITVSDNGPGIPEADRGRIFEPLFSTKTRNLGLGLSVSKSIAEKLGASLTVESSPGEGAAFSVLFPYRIPHDQA